MDSISMSLRIYYDSSIVVFLANNSKSGSRDKHICINTYPWKSVLEEVKCSMNTLILNWWLRIFDGRHATKIVQGSCSANETYFSLVVLIWFDLIWNSERLICFLFLFSISGLRMTNILWGPTISNWGLFLQYRVDALGLFRKGDHFLIHGRYYIQNITSEWLICFLVLFV